MPLAMALLSGAFSREERARALGIFSGVTGFALIAGPAAGGAITEGFGWQWIFWINLPIGAIAIALVCLRAFARVSVRPRAWTSPGLMLVAAAVGSERVWGLLRGNASGWASAEVVCALVAGLLSAAAFVVWEWRCTSADGADAVCS